MFSKNQNSVQTVIAITSVVVTIVVAYFAYKIQREIAINEDRRAAVSRSVALYRDFSESEAYKKLEEYRHEIQHRTWTDQENSEKKQNVRDHIAHSSREVVDERRDDVLRWFAALFQKTTLIYNCSGLKQKYEGQESSALCDPETIFILLENPLSELFFHYSSQFYCDEYIQSQFGGEKLHTPTSRYESLMMDFLERDFRGRKWGIYRDREAYKKAVEKGQIGSKSRNYSIMRYDGPCNLD